MALAGGGARRYAGGMFDLILSLVALAALALFGGAFVLWRRGTHNRQAALMVLLGVVMVINLAIWTVPDRDGAAPAEKLQDRATVDR